MSKLSDYSKFDHLNEDDSDDDDVGLDATRSKKNAPPEAPPVVASEVATTPTSDGPVMAPHGSKKGRYVFQYNGRPIYEWEQSLEDVTIYVAPPPHVTKGDQVCVTIQPQHLKLKLSDYTSWYLNEDTFGVVDVDESTWSLEDNDDEEDGGSHSSSSKKVITIYLTKANRGILWDAALKGNPNAAGGGASSTTSPTTIPTIDPVSKEEVKKEMLLERFQQEHPGFDFRGANFNGGIPDARTFMGGVKYD